MRAFVVCAVCAVARMAWGDPAPAPVPSADSKWWLGGELDLLVAGTVKESVRNIDTSTDATTTAAIGGLAEYRVSPLVSLGFAPRLLFAVHPEGTNITSDELDLRFRVTVGGNVAPRVRLYGIGTLGVGWIFNFVVDPASGNLDTVAGLIWSIGGGISYRIGPRLLFTGELSYQFGYEGTSVQGFSVGAGYDALTLGVGLMTPI